MNMLNVRRKIKNGNWRCLDQVSILSWPPLRDRAQGAGNFVAHTSPQERFRQKN